MYWWLFGWFLCVRRREQLEGVGIVIAFYWRKLQAYVPLYFFRVAVQGKEVYKVLLDCFFARVRLIVFIDALRVNHQSCL